MIYKRCPYCLGFKIKAARQVYIGLRRKFNIALENYAKEKNRDFLTKFWVLLDVLKKQIGPCSFCEGTGASVKPIEKFD